MKKYKLLLLDANIVIALFELGLWDAVVERCEILIARTVTEHEAKFYRSKQGDLPIELELYKSSNRITLVECTASELKTFAGQFDPTYLDALDAGEQESLAYLFKSQQTCLIASSDHIVYRILGRLGREEQGISLEEVLSGCGLGRRLPDRYCKSFREHWTQRGQQEMIRDTGLQKP